jgi:hypothetical protein
MKPVRVDPSGGISVRTAVVAIVIGVFVLVGSVGGVFLWLRGHNLQLQKALAEEANARLKSDIERQRLAEIARRELAQSRLTDTLALVRTATNSLEIVLDSRRTLISQSSELRTNELGSRLAAFPDLVGQARYLFGTEFRSLPTEPEVVTRLESVRRAELSLVSKVGTVYEPDAQITSSAHSQIAWAEEATRRILQSRSSLDALITEARVKVAPVPASTNSLEVAMQLLAQGEALLRQRAMQASHQEAQREADARISKAREAAVKTASEVEAQRLADEQAAIAAAAQRKRAELAAEAQKADTESKLAVSRTIDEARRLMLRRKAEDPKVRAKLAPFITPGYISARGVLSIESVPISFTELKSIGALERTENGLQNLIDVARTKRDKARPRWHFTKPDRESFKRYPEDMVRVEEAQALLVELGPTMVEMNLLAP